MGSSAAAISCYITALTNPPHLEAMAANMHPGDFYFDQWRVGGVFRLDNRIGWSVGMFARTSPIDPGDPAAPSYEAKPAVYEARFAHFGERVAAGKNAANLDWLTEMYQHDAYDEFWKAQLHRPALADHDPHPPWWRLVRPLHSGHPVEP